MTAPKRLIEVDLPIKRISAHARREKSIRHGHISTLHIWWARRPLAACRAVICAALWPDPADPHCPEAFQEVARAQMRTLATQHLGLLSAESCKRFVGIQKDAARLNDNGELRNALLDFIADFANWDNATNQAYLETARTLTQAAHKALGGELSTRPLVVDPFAGGGAIPLEALRVGADAFASDLNPVAVLLNKVLLEYIPKYGQQLADAVRKWGQRIKEQAEKELAEFYPKDPDGATPIAYLWARTICCEGPGCGAEVPLIRSLWLAKRSKGSVALRMVPNAEEKCVDFTIIHDAKARDVGEGTVRRGSAICPVCGYTTPVASVRRQLKACRGGAADARLFCVVTTRPEQQGRFYRSPMDCDLEAVRNAAMELERRKKAHTGSLALVPDEEISLNEIRRISVPIYGMVTWGDLFTPRQALALTTLSSLVRENGKKLGSTYESNLAVATQACLALAVDRCANQFSSISKWNSGRELVDGVFARQALPMLWDFGEINILGSGDGYWLGAISWITAVFEALSLASYGHAEYASATAHPLPDDAVDALITDPPYYDAVPYAYLSDYFYVWLRRSLALAHPNLLRETLVPKDAEIVVDRPHELSKSTKNVAFYERELTKAFAEGHRVLRSNGIGTIVFASKTTASWEAILQAVVEAGWVVTGSWPIDTEMETRVAAQGQARLASSIHLVCRPREKASVNSIGDWRNVLAELPKRIHEWMPRLVAEGVVGADAIFACLGPAVEIFSRYSHVEKASGEQVTLREYLEHVWAAVAREALGMIFAGADATGFEEDARLTALWLWTLFSGQDGNGQTETRTSDDEGEGDDEEESGGAKQAAGGYVLEFDAARKIAQGLGVHLERLTTVIEVKGEKARLLPVAERARSLLGKEAGQVPVRRRKQATQLAMFDATVKADGEDAAGWDDGAALKAGETTLDRLHQSMLLFAASRSEALKHFLVEDGIGQDQRFWRLAQSLSALYPSGSEEKRWIDGLLARKRGWGL